MGYHKVTHTMPEYKRIYFESIMDRLDYTISCFICWFLLYFVWSWIDLAHHILNIFGIWSNRLEYHMALYWMYFVVIDVPWAIHLTVMSLIHVFLKISQTSNLH